MGPDGNLYGTTAEGGAYGGGTLFKLQSNSDGAWTETIIRRFGGSDPAGAAPRCRLVFDRWGNLYGTTQEGGSGGQGTVFELIPQPNGQWAETVLHAFDGGPDGGNPDTGVIMDRVGNLYGATYYGGLQPGNIYELGRVSVFRRYELALHMFQGTPDGSYPNELVLDSEGNLYGTTEQGGAYGQGMSYRLTPNRSRDGWTETVLYSFTGGEDGGIPIGSLVLDQMGNLYGTASIGGPCQQAGVAFELSANPDGTWTESLVYPFGCLPTDPLGPSSGLTFDSIGNLYGEAGGSSQGPGGAIFKLFHAGGQWNASVVYGFPCGMNGCPDGVAPYGGLTMDAAGNLYGTTTLGGSRGLEREGVVFELSPE